MYLPITGTLRIENNADSKNYVPQHISFKQIIMNYKLISDL